MFPAWVLPRPGKDGVDGPTASAGGVLGAPVSNRAAHFGRPEGAT